MKISYLYEYLDLAETLNFSLTAERLHITQPALSRHIKKIEEYIGTELFLRDTRNVILTPAGIITEKYFREMVQNLNVTKELALKYSDEYSKTLKISSPYYWTAKFTEPAVNLFNEIYPQFKIEIIPCEPPEGFSKVKSGSSDLVLCQNCSDNIEDSIASFQFSVEPNVIVVRSDHPMANQSSISIKNMHIDTYVCMGGAYIPLYDRAPSIMRNCGITIGKTINVDYIDSLAISIYKTNGISIMPESIYNMNRDYLSYIPIVDKEYIIPMSYYYLIDNPNPLIPKFLQVTNKVFG